MKKIALILALMMSLSLFAACGSNAPADDSAAAPATLEQLMDKAYEGIPEEEMPVLPSAEDLKMMNPNNTGKYLEMAADLSDEDSVYYTGVARSAYKEGILSEPMMMGVAHRVIMLRAENAEAAAQLAKDVEANANPRWNICTEAEKTVVTQLDDVVVLIMSTEAMADAMAANLAA